MPILKYTLFVGSSLLLLIVAADYMIAPPPAVVQSSSSSLEVLKKMANHGEARGFAPLAYAGEFHPVPAMQIQPVQIAVEPALINKPDAVAIALSPAALDAQARVSESDVIDRPARRQKKASIRKPKQSRTDYVENVRHSPFGFFSNIQSW